MTLRGRCIASGFHSRVEAIAERELEAGGIYGLGVLVVVVAVLWRLGAVPGWVVPAVLVLTVIVFVLLWRSLDRFRRTLASGSPSDVLVPEPRFSAPMPFRTHGTGSRRGGNRA